MDDANKRAELEQRVAGRRRELGDRASLDPRLRARSPEGRVLPPRLRGKPSTLAVVLLAAVGAVALIACVVTTVGIVISSTWLQGALNDPSATAQSFCGALQQRDYAHAYGYFSASAQEHTSESAFADQFAGYDAIDGPVTSYSLGSPRYSTDGAIATLAVMLQRQSGGSAQQQFTLVLIKEHGSWRINALTIKTHAGAPPKVRGE
jgi:hypothetical protein